MATQARGPSFSYYVRRPYQQVDQPPNLPLGPFPKVPPFIAREEGNDTQFRKKWAQDFYWAGTTTQGIPAQPVQQVQFRAPFSVPIFSKPRLQPDLVPNNLPGLYRGITGSPPFIPAQFQETYRRSDRDFMELQVLSYLPGPVSEPFFSVDFPITFRAKQTPQDFTFESTKIPVAAPFYQLDWPLYARAKALHQDFYWSGQTTQGIPGRTPAVPYDWPTPMPKRWVQDFYWLGNTTRTIPPAPAPIAATSDFPAILTRKRESYSDSYSSPIVLLTTIIYPPFYQNEWEEIYRKARPTFFDVSLNWALYPGTSAPLTGLIMPNLVGLNIWEALALLQSVGILVPAKIGYFGTFPITIDWIPVPVPTKPYDLAQDFIVEAQSLKAGLQATVNQPITLTVYSPSVSVAFPG